MQCSRDLLACARCGEYRVRRDAADARRARATEPAETNSTAVVSNERTCASSSDRTPFAHTATKRAVPMTTPAAKPAHGPPATPAEKHTGERPCDTERLGDRERVPSSVDPPVRSDSAAPLTTSATTSCGRNVLAGAARSHRRGRRDHERDRDEDVRERCVDKLVARKE